MTNRVHLDYAAAQDDLQLRHEYGDSHQWDQIARLFPAAGRGMVRVPHPGGGSEIHGWDTPKSQIHHLWARTAGNKRWDRCWNLVSTSQWTHDFCHDYKADGIVLCVTAKLALPDWHYEFENVLLPHWDREAARKTLGFDPVGWIENHKCEWPWAEEIRRQLLASLAERGAA